MTAVALGPKKLSKNRIQGSYSADTRTMKARALFSLHLYFFFHLF